MPDKSDITIEYGSLWPEGHFGRTVAQGFADAIKAGTDGRITVIVTPPLSDDGLTQDVLSGKIAMTSGHAIQDYVPELGLGYLPYLYDSYDEFRSVWTLGSPISNDILSYFQKRKIKAVPIGYSVIGFRDMILKNRSIEKASDFKSLKVRNDGSSTTHDVFKAFGADPQVIEYHKVKEALADGTIQAAANTTYNLIYMQWYQETTNVSLTSHQILTNLEIVNIDFWNSLSKNDQDLFRASMHDACALFAQTAQKERSLAIDKLGGALGMQVNEVSAETKAQLAREVEPMKRAFVAQYQLEKEYEKILAMSK
jgi:C4-dicarboxylate-binding protein DctP